MACSLAPAYFHHWRSSASIFWSRSLSLLEESSSASRANLRASADPATTHRHFRLASPAVPGFRPSSRACLPAGAWTALQGNRPSNVSCRAAACHLCRSQRSVAPPGLAVACLSAKILGMDNDDGALFPLPDPPAGPDPAEPFPFAAP